MKYILTILVLSCFSSAHSQILKVHYKKLPGFPVMFIDSVNVDAADLKNHPPAEIAFVNVYDTTRAIYLIGPDGRDGVIFAETKKYAKKRYWIFLKNKSADYFRVVPSAAEDSTVVYILNGNVLKDDFDYGLSQITNESFSDLKIINKKHLVKDYDITNKTFGVLITTKRLIK